MSVTDRQAVIEALRLRVKGLERGASQGRSDRGEALPFGIGPIDAALPEGGMVRAALHEVFDGNPYPNHGAVAAAWIGGIAARLDGVVLWCLRGAELHGAALACLGLNPARLILAQARSEAEILWSMEEGLRHPGLAAVVGELTKLDLTPSRRLQLAAETSGVTGFVLHRGDAEIDRPNAAMSRWRVSSLPSTPLPVPGIGRARWHMELLRCRGGKPAAWIVESCDETGHLHLPAELADRSAASRPGSERSKAAAAG